MKLIYKGISVFYSDTGKGSAVILLHGFLENSSMWKDTVKELSKRNRIICIDLLGHGQTHSLGYVHSMETMAAAVEAVLKQLQLRKYYLVGHSMGGYVALALAEKNHEKIKGLCLLNSTFEQDDDDRKKLRKRANKMAKDNYKSLVQMSFNNLFSKESRERFSKEIKEALKEALKTPVQGYMAANEGMIIRENKKPFFVNAPFKKAIIIGKKDWIVDAQKMKIFAQKNTINCTILSQGHMSYIENKHEMIKAIKAFLK